MYTVDLTIKGITPLQQSKEYTSRETKRDKETHDTYEKRTWRLRSHFNEDGFVIHPAGALKQALIAAARYSGHQIPGQGKKTYTAKVTSGVAISKALVTDKKESDIVGVDVFCSSDGGRGAKSGRVWKTFPTLMEWTARTQVIVFDDIVTEDILRYLLEETGRFIGIGTWRPENGGENGRFTVIDFHVS